MLLAQCAGSIPTGVGRDLLNKVMDAPTIVSEDDSTIDLDGPDVLRYEIRETASGVRLNDFEVSDKFRPVKAGSPISFKSPISGNVYQARVITTVATRMSEKSDTSKGTYRRDIYVDARPTTPPPEQQDPSSDVEMLDEDTVYAILDIPRDTRQDIPQEAKEEPVAEEDEPTSALYVDESII